MNARTAGSDSALENRCINTIRTLTMDAVEKAGSGHPGAPMGLAPAAYVLWTRVMKHSPANPDWLDRDRFVLSAGHASMLLYSLLHLTGYDVSLEDIRHFRQWGSRTPGHPEFGRTPGVEITTGPLGQGFANAVGMAMAERHLAGRFNRPGFDIVDHRTYVVCGDGDLMEGVSAEAASLAGHLGLSRLICIYDDNGVSIEGPTAMTFTEDVARRFEAYRWQVLRVPDGNDTAAIEEALTAARGETERPSLIVLKTEIACGSPNKRGTAAAHGAPLGAAEVRMAKAAFGFPEDASFHVPAEVLTRFRACVDRGREAESRWQETFRSFARAHSEVANQWLDAVSGFLGNGWDDALPVFSPSDPPVATRAASGKVLNAIAGKVPSLMGGAADLAPSTQTLIDASVDFQKGRYDGRNVRFGVREHAMGGIMNGMYLHHGVRPYGGTFLAFSDYLRPSIRLAAIMRLSVIYIFTHDSIAVGEDGPTHQPVEHLAALRAIPGLTVIRPADANETAAAWRQAITTTGGPVAIVLSRQKLPVLKRAPKGSSLNNGAYILADPARKPDLILIASGSEVHLATAAVAPLAARGVAARIVSMPSWELFEKTSPSYRDSVLPPDIKVRLAVEAGVPMGWERYVGAAGEVIGIDGFGASAPGSTLMERFGFTLDHVVERSLALLERTGGGNTV